jgi:pimeloyl-ACP methyl ester carboxylesterase
MTTYAFLETQRLRFAYLAEGDGPLVVLLHGFPDTARGYDPIRPALAEAGFRAFSPNLRGYAPSAIPADGKYDTESIAMDVLSMLDALHARRIILIGHDWGANTAYAVAALAPERIRTLVTIGLPHPAAIEPSLGLMIKARHMLYFQLPSAVAGTRANDFAYVDTLYRRWSPTWQFTSAETAPVKEALRQPGSLEAALGYYRALRGLSPAHRRIVRVPTFCFAGDDDPNLSLAVYHGAASRFDARYQVVSMPGGHFMHREYPERFLELLLPIVRDAPA